MNNATLPHLELLSAGNSEVKDKRHFVRAELAQLAGQALRNSVVEWQNNATLPHLELLSAGNSEVKDKRHFVRAELAQLAGNSTILSR